jgi:hypothetical protein
MGTGGPSCRRQEGRASLSADRREDGFDCRDEEDIATKEVRALMKRAAAEHRPRLPSLFLALRALDTCDGGIRSMRKPTRTYRPHISALVVLPTLTAYRSTGPQKKTPALHAGVSVAPLPRPNDDFSSASALGAGFRAAPFQYRPRSRISKSPKLTFR